MPRHLRPRVDEQAKRRARPGPRMRPVWASDRGGPPGRSLHAEQFDFEEQGRIGRDHAAGPSFAVGEFGREQEQSLAADPHRGDALVPTLDDLALAECELEGLIPVVRTVELLALLPALPEPAGI